MATVKPIVVVCAWCADNLAKSAAARAAGFDVSHGLCDECDQRLQADESPFDTLEEKEGNW